MILKKYSLLLILIIISSLIFSQNTSADNFLNTFTNTKQDTSKIDILIKIGNKFEKKKSDSSIYYYKKALNIAENKKLVKYIVKTNFFIANAYYDMAYYNLANKYLNDCYSYIDDAIIPENKINYYNLLALTYYKLNKNGKALKKAFKALEISKKNNLKDYEVIVLNTIGTIYDELKYYNKALQFYNKSYKLVKELNDIEGEAVYYINSGVALLNLKKYDEANERFNKALKIYKDKNDAFDQSVCIENISNIYKEQKKYNKALENYFKALKISDSINDIIGKSSISEGIADVYFEEKQYAKSIEYYKKSIELANTINEKKYLLNLYKKISEAYSKVNNNKNALVFFKKYKNLNDTVLLENNNKQIAKFNAERKDLKLKVDNAYLKHNLKEKEISNKILKFTILPIVIILFFLIILLIKLVKQKKEIEAKDDDYEALLNANVNVIAMVNIFGELLYINDAVTHVFDYEKSEVLNKSINEIVPRKVANLFSKKLKEVISQKELKPFEVELQHKTGRIIDVEISGKLIWYRGKKVAVSTVRDITEKKKVEGNIKQAHANLAKQNEKYNLIVSNINDFIWFLDLNFKPIYLSPSVKSFLGYTQEELNKIDFERLHKPVLAKKIKELVYREVNEQGVNFKTTQTIKYIHKNGQIIIAEVNARAVVDKDGVIKGVAGVSRDITQRIILEKRVKESERSYKYLVENLSIGITIIDDDNNFIIVNKASKKIFDTRDLIGKNLNDFLDIDTYNSLKEKSYKIKAGHKDDFDIGVTTKAGVNKIINVKVIPNFSKDNKNTTIAIFTDVTEERKTFDKLLKSETNYRNLFDNSPIALLEEDYSEIKALLNEKKKEGVTDIKKYITKNPDFLNLCISKYKIININNEVLKLFKVKTKQAFKKNANNFFTETSKKTFIKQLLIVFFADVKEFDREIRLLNNKGKNLSLYMKLFVFDNYKKVVVAMTDISERKKFEKQIIKAKKSAENANRLKSLFLANMSHEIRTPLNAIIGFSDILHSRIKNEEHKSFVDNIITSGNNLLNLINDILDISKIEANELKIEMAPMNIRETVADIETMFIEKTKQRNLDLKIDIENTIPEKIILDELRIKQILINLVGNAIKFTEYGYVAVNVYSQNIDDNKLDLFISVKDTGIGIPSDQTDAIFDTFKQADGQSLKHFDGAGLGLSISKNLAKLMGGDIYVTSNNEGTKFTVVLRSIKVVANNGNIWKNADIQKTNIVKILYADDNLMNLELFKAIADDFGVVVIVTKNGKEALDILKNEMPDIILLDVQMPVLDGYETAKVIRQNKKFDTIPIFSLSAKIELDKVGFFDKHITKPIGKEKFKTKILNWNKS